MKTVLITFLTIVLSGSSTSWVLFNVSGENKVKKIIPVEDLQQHKEDGKWYYQADSKLATGMVESYDQNGQLIEAFVLVDGKKEG